MEVTVNGAPEVHPDGLTVRELLQAHRLAESPCAVEVNRELVPKRRHTERRLADGDRVEIVTLVGGG